MVKDFSFDSVYNNQINDLSPPLHSMVFACDMLDFSKYVFVVVFIYNQYKFYVLYYV